MTVSEAVMTRYSCPFLSDRPVSAGDRRRRSSRLAARAPSGGNLQPWQVDVLAGAALAGAEGRASLPASPPTPAGEGTEFAVYPSALGEPVARAGASPAASSSTRRSESPVARPAFAKTGGSRTSSSRSSTGGARWSGWQVLASHEQA